MTSGGAAAAVPAGAQGAVALEVREWPQQRPITRVRLGEMAHIAAALTYAASLGFSTGAASLSFIALMCVTILRLPHTWRSYAILGRDRVGLLMAAWVVWNAASLLWSPDVHQGLRELRSYRAIATPLLIWPVVDRTPWLILAFLLGVAMQNLVQLGQGLDLISRDPHDGPRLRGMVHPVIAATLCLAAMCWHLSAVLTGRGWVRWVSAAGFVAAGVGAAFTGSRGPWIAAMITVPAALLTLMIRQPQVRKPALAMSLAIALCAAAAWPIVRDVVDKRLQRTRADIELIEHGTYGMDVGHRLASWQAAWEIFLADPLLGAGAGGYRIAAATTSRADLLTTADHAHSSYFQILACTGAIGAALWLALIGAALARAWTDQPDHPFASGTFFALMGWLIAAAFDASHLNGQMFGLLALQLAVITRPLRQSNSPI